MSVVYASLRLLSVCPQSDRKTVIASIPARTFYARQLCFARLSHSIGVCVSACVSVTRTLQSYQNAERCKLRS